MRRDDDWYDRPATQWFSRIEALAELRELKFAISAMAETVGTGGSFEREMAGNASRGIARRIDYLHDSFLRLVDPK
jgi:hypothetical protein